MRRSTGTILLLVPAILTLFCNFPQEPAQIDRSSRGMKLIPGGTFTMGSNDTALGSSAKPAHPVTVDSFYMDSTEVTQLEYTDIIGYNPAAVLYSPSVYQHYPVECVSWYDAILFANARSKRFHLDTVYSYSKAVMIITPGSNGAIQFVRCSTMTDLSCDWSKKGYRLPTEAEWEYACRAGTTTINYWGDNLESSTIAKYAWFYDNASWHLNVTAWKLPNARGLRDMIGNVWEWCYDRYAEGYPPGSAFNPKGPDTGTKRVIRGGAQTSIIDDNSLRSASRGMELPENYPKNCGIRLVLPK